MSLSQSVAVVEFVADVVVFVGKGNVERMKSGKRKSILCLIGSQGW